MDGKRIMMPGKMEMRPILDASLMLWQSVWSLLSIEGTAGTVFYDGAVCDQFAFSAMMSSPSVHPFRVMCDDKIAGLVWLSNLEPRACRGHFVVFRKYWCISRKIGAFALRRLLEQQYDTGEYCFDVVTGHIPSWNKPAINVALKAGFRQTGTIPLGAWNHKEGRSHDMVVLAATREDVCKSGQE